MFDEMLRPFLKMAEQAKAEVDARHKEEMDRLDKVIELLEGILIQVGKSKQGKACREA